MGWAGISLGTTLLLATVVIFALALTWWTPLLPWSWSAAPHETRDSRGTGAWSWPAVAYVGENPPENPEAQQTATSAPAPTPRSQTASAPGYPAYVRPDEPPWAATKCVAALNPDPADARRWLLENGCGIPVAIVFATCDEDPATCDSAALWTYEADGLILPAKLQRTITTAEETRYGRRIRYLACYVTTPAVVDLIGMDVASRASSSWVEQFAAARADDECLLRVQGSSVSGTAIDVPPGRSEPDG